MLHHCRDCRFYVPMPGVLPEGECHRYPPAMLIFERNIEAYWSEVEDSDWCGEWQSNSKETSTP